MPHWPVPVAEWLRPEEVHARSRRRGKPWRTPRQMNMLELINAIADQPDAVRFQLLSDCMSGNVSTGKNGVTKITFQTKNFSCGDILTGKGRIGVVLWLDRDAAVKAQKKADADPPAAPSQNKAFDYLISYGGGEGPDVWDREIEVCADNIADAARQAHARAQEEDGWAFSVVQNDYPPTTREKLEKRLHEIHLEIDGYIDGAPDRSEASSLANRIQSILDGNP